jgi:iron complex outermembrane receptor protein
MKILLLPIALLVVCLSAQAEEPAAFQLEDVVVKGKGRATETEQRQQANVAKIIIPKEELEKSGELSVSDYLKKVPGLGPVGSKGRNIAGGAPQILVDGVLLSGGRDRAQLSRLSLDMIERIEVTRSPTAALSNESAGAVVNIVLKNTIQQALKAGLNLGVGENTSRLGGGINGQVGARQDDFSWVIVGSYYQRGILSTSDSETRSFDTVGTTTDWTRETSDGRGYSRNLNLTPKLTWQLNATDKLLIEPSVSYSQNPFERERLLFDYPDTPTGSITEDSNDTHTSARLRGEWLRKQGQAERTLKASVQRGIGQNDKTTWDYDAAHVLTGTRSEDGEARDWAVDLSAQIKEPVAPQHLLTSGVEYAWRKQDEDQDLVIDGMPVVGGAATSFNIGGHSWVAYVQDEWAMNDKMSLTPGLRFRHLERDSEDGAGVTASASSSTFSPSLHYLWKTDERLNFRASASHILKPPSFSDLTTVISTSDGTQTNPDQSGNPNLKNETAWVYNLGLEHYLAEKAGVLGINFFYRDLTNLIQRRTQEEAPGYFV